VRRDRLSVGLELVGEDPESGNLDRGCCRPWTRSCQRARQDVDGTQDRAFVLRRRRRSGAWRQAHRPPTGELSSELERGASQLGDLLTRLTPGDLGEPEFLTQFLWLHPRLVVANGAGPAEHLEGDALVEHSLFGDVG